MHGKHIMKYNYLILNARQRITYLFTYGLCLLTALPQLVKCSGFFSDSSAAENVVQAFCTAYQNWFLAILLVFIFLTFFTHDDKKRAWGIGAIIISFVVFALSKNPTFITNTANEVAGWWGAITGDGSSNSGGSKKF